MKKPIDLLYSHEETPPFRVLLPNAIQQTGLLALSLVFPLMVGRAAGLEAEALVTFVGLSLVAMALANAIAGVKLGWFGSGYLVPLYPPAVFATPALLAIDAGGIPLLAGMTIFSGLFVIAVGFVLPHLRQFFTSEIAGLVILIVGLSVSLLGLKTIAPSASEAGAELLIGLAALGVMVAIQIWSRRSLASYATMIGVAFAVVLHLTFGEPAALPAVPLVAAPALFSFSGFAFSPALMVPFAVVMLVVALSVVGDTTNAQKINDAGWTRPDMRSIRGGNVATGAAIAACGLLHGCPVATSSSNVGLTRASGVASRRLAFAIAALLLLLAFSPALLGLLALIPDVAIGVTWLLLGAFIVMSGMEIITSRLLDVRRSLIVGLALPIGFSAHFYPELYAGVPSFLKPVTADMLTLGTTAAVLLNAVFRIGVKQKVRLTLDGPDPLGEQVHDALRLHGARWAARAEVIDRAGFALRQLIETLEEQGRIERDLAVELSFDEFSLVITVSYVGTAAPFPEMQPQPDDLLSDDGVEQLAGYLVRRTADRFRLAGSPQEPKITLFFEH